MIRRGNHDQILPVVLTQAEMAADAWHLYSRGQWQLCPVTAADWSTCPLCRLRNPHFRAGWQAKFDDIRARLSHLYESRSEHVPRKDDRRQPLGRGWADRNGED